MVLWQQIIALILTPALVVGALAWLLRKFFELGLQRDLERYKSELQRQNYEYQIKYSISHQKRAEVIASLYGRLVRAKNHLADLVSPLQHGGQSLPEKKSKVAETYHEAASFFFEHRIFLPENTSVKIEQVLDGMRESFYTFDVAQLDHDEYKHDKSGYWMKSHKIVRDELPPLLVELEGQFRHALGVIEKRASESHKDLQSEDT
jgi:hypothetical protein